ncbi:endonuclease V [Lacipirellula sp.]|uniref:endonuclease V n=1 Tax=Lacipirellula sp. TaxID=2691419 RepID=UPI003D143218
MTTGSRKTSEPLLALDVCYSGETAHVAGLTFACWEDAEPIRILESTLHTPAEYLPGEFYRRELPCLLALIESFELSPEIIVVDGFVYLDGHDRPGLGKRLFDALGGRTAVIGVAKSPFHAISPACEVFRGRSSRPLYVTSAGIPLDAAKIHVARMHGAHRMPTLLKRIDAVSKAF